MIVDLLVGRNFNILNKVRDISKVCICRCEIKAGIFRLGPNIPVALVAGPKVIRGGPNTRGVIMRSFVFGSASQLRLEPLDIGIIDG